MKLKKTIAGIALLTLFPLQSFAAMNGNEVLNACDRKDTKGMCIAYISGIFEGMVMQDVFLEKTNVTTQSYLCVPSGVVNSQIVDVTLNFIRSNSDIRHYEVAPLVLLAVREKFPC